MPTLHTNANKEDVAKVVLMPGDPTRAKSIAERFLTSVKVISPIRGIALYTGYSIHNKRMSVMASGMGQPSIGIYAHELYSLGAEMIIRVGTAGSFNPDIHVNDVLIADNAHTTSNFAYQLNREDIYDCEASIDAVEIAKEILKDSERKYVVGTIFTNDAFYGETKEMHLKWSKEGYIGIEMETFALYYTAKLLNKKALALLTVSNHFINKEVELSQEDKAYSMKNMISLAVEIAEHYA